MLEFFHTQGRLVCGSRWRGAGLRRVYACCASISVVSATVRRGRAGNRMRGTQWKRSPISARLWVEMARSWAAQGVRVLRLDLGGLGDSPTRPGRQQDEVYPVEAIEDIIDAVRFIAPAD